MADQTLSSGCSQVGLGEWKSKLLNLGIISSLATMVTLFMSSLDDDRAGWGKGLIGIHTMDHHIHSRIKILLKFAFTWGTNTFISLPILKVLFT